jgi:cytochrome oxidase Cu insertion factor (SCO1/SenC/PrrC family)
MTPRTKFLLLLALFILPTIASFIAFYFLPPPAPTNYGQLITPAIPLPEVTPRRLDVAKEEVPPTLRGKWLIVTRDRGACDERCRMKLAAMRQSRLVLGRDQDRVLRVVLVDDDVSPAAGTQKEFEGSLWLSAKSFAWISLLPVPKDADPYGFIYLVDPLGNAFMRYGDAPDIKLMANDLRRVLKASQIG